MNEILRIYDSGVSYVAFTAEEATDTGQIKPAYGIQIGQKETAGSELKQQIRPGLRLIKAYAMAISEAKYISLLRMLSNQSSDYYIRWVDVPSLLANDPDALETNDIKIAVTIQEVSSNAGGEETIYYFTMTVASVKLI